MTQTQTTWDTDQFHQTQQRVLEAVQRKPQTLADLGHMLAKEPQLGGNQKKRKALAKQIVDQFLQEGRLYEHPGVGRGSIRYGDAPADPDKYITMSKLKELQTIYRKLVKAKVHPPVGHVDQAATTDGQLHRRRACAANVRESRWWSWERYY